MRPCAAVVGFWAALLAASGTTFAVWYPQTDSWYLLLGAAAAMLTIAIALQVGPRARLERRSLPTLSLPAVLLGWGAAIAVTGVAFGLWLILIGLGLAVLALAGLIRESLAMRREARW